MRTQDNVVQPEERMVLPWGFVFEDVQSGTSEMAALHGVDHGRVVDNFSTCRVNQHTAGFHLGNHFGVEHSRRLLIEGAV